MSHLQFHAGLEVRFNPITFNDQRLNIQPIIEHLLTQSRYILTLMVVIETALISNLNIPVLLVPVLQPLITSLLVLLLMDIIWRHLHREDIRVVHLRRRGHIISD